MGGIEAGTPADFTQRFLGITPHDGGQIDWLNCRAKTKVACCGRRWGKTYSTAADLLWFACTKPGTTQFLVAPTYDQVIILFRYVERLVRERFPEQIPAKVVQSPFPEIVLANGSSIKARSAGNDASNLRGHGADRIVMDEAAFIAAGVYETISPLMATSEFGELVLISTPFGRNTFFDYWQQGQTGDPAIRSFRFPSENNPHLKRDYLEQQRQEMSSQAYRTEYQAEFLEDVNAVFPYSLIQSCIDASEPPAGQRVVIGYDPAKWQDRSGVVALDISGQPWRVIDVLDISGRDYLIQATEIARLSAQHGGAPVLMDSTSHDQMLEQLRHDGVKAEGFKFTNESKQELINGLVIAMEQEKLKIPNHRDLLNELTYYRYELTAAGNVRLGADAQHHDDLVTALALAVRSATTPRAFRSGDVYAALSSDVELDPIFSHG